MDGLQSGQPPDLNLSAYAGPGSALRQPAPRAAGRPRPSPRRRRDPDPHQIHRRPSAGLSRADPPRWCATPPPAAMGRIKFLAFDFAHLGEGEAMASGEGERCGLVRRVAQPDPQGPDRLDRLCPRACQRRRPRARPGLQHAGLRGGRALLPSPPIRWTRSRPMRCWPRRSASSAPSG